MMQIGIIGLPNVGKSTLFKALTNVQIDIQNYPFTTIEPNVGVVEVPDERVDALSIMSNSKKKLYATVEFTDIAGLVKGAAQGEGLGNKFLANIREVDAIAQVVRAFEDSTITHVHNRIDPANDIEIINTELIIADLDTVTKNLEKTEKDSKSGDKTMISNLEILKKFKQTLESGVMIYHNTASEYLALAKKLNLLTAKKFIYVINVSEEQLLNNWPGSRASGSSSATEEKQEASQPGKQPNDKLWEIIGDAPYIIMCNKLELALSEATPDEKKEYLTEFLPAQAGNLPESGLDKLIKTGYEALGLLTFLTTGEKETRAWTAHIGDLIPRASSAIHTDFERLFIRAEVINWRTLLEAGSHANARNKGLIRTVGRDYITQEGDVVNILIGS